MAIPGDRLQTYCRVIETALGPGGEGVPVLGLQCIPDLLMGPSGALPFSRFSYDEIGDGWYAQYVQTLATDPPGDYELHFHVNNEINGQPENSAFTQVWNVFAFASGSSAVYGGMSRREIRRSVAHMLNDFYLVTAYGAPETNAFTDPITLARETGHFNGMQAVFSTEDS